MDERFERLGERVDRARDACEAAQLELLRATGELRAAAAACQHEWGPWEPPAAETGKRGRDPRFLLHFGPGGRVGAWERTCGRCGELEMTYKYGEVAAAKAHRP